MSLNEFKLFAKNVNTKYNITDNTNTEYNKEYISHVLYIIKNWKHDLYGPEEILRTNNIGISFNYDAITSSTDIHAITIWDYRHEDPEYINMSFDQFKNLLLLIHCFYITPRIKTSIGNYEIEANYDNIHIYHGLTASIKIPQNSFTPILDVWDQILPFDLHYHMEFPPDEIN
jgi:hypothetical protein